MFLFIYLVAQDIFIHCAETMGCINISASHFNHLLSIGALEMILETPMVVRIYKYTAKFLKEQQDKDKENNK